MDKRLSPLSLPGWDPRFAERPLCRTVAHWAPRFAGCAAWPDAARLNHLADETGLRNAAGRPVRFEPQHAPCGQRQYEGQILETGVVPTRPDNWHDFFNALIWLTFPKTKAALNAVQCRELEGASKGQRSPASDAATLYDESGLLLIARDDALARLLRAKRWKAAFWELRAAWAEARFYVIGHAVLEKAVGTPAGIEDACNEHGPSGSSPKANIGAADVKPAPAGGRRQKASGPYPGMTGKCLFLQVDALPEAEAAPPEWLDAQVAQTWLNGAIGRPADLFVMPVLGVPGLCAENAEAAFYDNTEVFRPPRNA